MTRGIHPRSHTAPLEDGAMIAAWMVRSGQPAEPEVYDGRARGAASSMIRAGVELTLADEQGRMIARTLDAEQLDELIAALQVHRRNIEPQFRRLDDIPQA